MNDTHPAIDRKHIQLLRALTPTQRLELALNFSRGVMRLSREQFNVRHGKLGLQRWLEAHYGARLARGALGDQYRESLERDESKTEDQS
jgi:hypothetical protein